MSKEDETIDFYNESAPLDFYNKPSPFAFLMHYGIKGMKWGVRRTPEQLGHRPKKAFAKSNKNGTILEEFTISFSLGAKAKNYQVYDPESGRYYPFAEGTRIRNPKVFAGKGGVKSLRQEVMSGLAEQFGGKPTEWQHCKGFGTLDCDGEYCDAEVHWFQEPTVGKHKFRVKKWLY